MARRLGLWVLGVLLLSGLTAAQPIVHHLQVEDHCGKDSAEIVAQNDYGVPCTVTLSAELTNMAGSPSLPLTVVVPGHTRQVLTRLTPLDSGQRWRYQYKFHFVWGSTRTIANSNAVYRLPYPSGQSYRLIQGYHGTFSHYGDEDYALDFGCPEGTPVLAARAGTVLEVEDGYLMGAPDRGLGANYVVVEHDDGTLAEYLHLRPGGVAVSPGTRVAAGNLLGYSGNTGFTDGPHLHFMVFRARDGYHRESVPTVFRLDASGSGVTLQEGETYLAP